MYTDFFHEKKILLVCREEFSRLLFFLAKNLIKSNALALYYVKPSETKFNKNISNESSFYFVKEKLGVPVYTTNDIADEFTSTLKSDTIIDVDYLTSIEENYSHFLNLNAQLVCTQELTRHYHYRYFWKYVNDVQQTNWLILNYKNVEKVLDDFNPDVVVSCDNEELGYCVLREVCYYKKIPFVGIDYPRYDIYKIFSYDLGLHINEYLKERYNNYILNSHVLKEELGYIMHFREKETIMHEMYKDDAVGTSQYKPDPLIKSVKNFIKLLLLLFKQDVIAKNASIKSSNPVLYPSSGGYIKYFAHMLVLKQMLMRKNRYFHQPIDGEKYVYMPLHLIPEATTFSLSPFYVNELTIIEAVSKSLPAGWKLYVKEHQSMLGERSLEFYKKVNRLPNVKMVQLNYYTDPKPWILKSQGVITISGTTAYEAALLGKQSVVFSDVSFSLIDGVNRIRSFEDLPEALARFKNSLHNEYSCAAFIKAVKDCGMPIDIKYLIKCSTEYIKKDSYNDSLFDDYINKLEEMLYKGYSLYGKYCK